ncbi:hypothetical protein [Robbsia sp. KACC 23696]|uniref:hypothetical protein n=1 Tax=Robbsia sp. KACC 23696 TaxID=3149231 RepID=UPI00325C100A
MKKDRLSGAESVIDRLFCPEKIPTSRKIYFVKKSGFLHLHVKNCFSFAARRVCRDA